MDHDLQPSLSKPNPLWCRGNISHEWPEWHFLWEPMSLFQRIPGTNWRRILFLTQAHTRFNVDVVTGHTWDDHCWSNNPGTLWCRQVSAHDDVIKWNSLHKGQWRGALLFYLICTRFETPSRPLWRHCNASNYLQWLDLKLRLQSSEPGNDRQGNMLYFRDYYGMLTKQRQLWSEKIISHHLYLFYL